MRKFRYVVLNDNNMKEPQTAVGPNPMYVKALLESNGDKIRIIQELPPDDETQNYGKMDVGNTLNTISNAQGWQAGGTLPAGGMVDMSSMDNTQLNALAKMQEKLAGGPQQTQINGQVVQPQGVQKVPQQPESFQIPQQPVQTQVPPAAPKKEEPKYFNIAGIECKQENGKIYQKQWVRISEVEMANYRLISDKNNKILPMVGKHLEVQKWILSEDNQD